MEERKWFDEYSGQSTDELIALEGDYRIDSLVVAFEQAVDQKAARIGMENLTDEERIILAVEALEREVNNGGYDQFFINSSNEFAPIIVDSLKRIGCSGTAEVTHEAITALAIERPVTVEAIEDVMDEDSDERDDKLDECDEEYYETGENIAGRLFEFIKNNRDKITLRQN